MFGDIHTNWGLGDNLALFAKIVFGLSQKIHVNLCVHVWCRVHHRNLALKCTSPLSKYAPAGSHDGSHDLNLLGHMISKVLGCSFYIYVKVNKCI